MKEALQKKLLIPLVALAIVTIGGKAYTLNHSGPTIIHAQQAVGQLAPDKEVQDDTVKATSTNTVDKPEANDTVNTPQAGDKPDVPGQANTTE